MIEEVKTDTDMREQPKPKPPLRFYIRKNRLWVVFAAILFIVVSCFIAEIILGARYGNKSYDTFCAGNNMTHTIMDESHYCVKHDETGMKQDVSVQVNIRCFYLAGKCEVTYNQPRNIANNLTL